MLSLRAVAKEFDYHPVLDDINLDVEAGRRYVLSAPNGSGKTTLLHIMSGLSKPSRGSVRWMGGALDNRARRMFGVVLQEPMLYGDLTGMESLLFYGRLFHVADVRVKAEQWLRHFELTGAANVKVRDFSKGMKQRLAIARACLHEPRVLLLDEPYDGLDGSGVERARCAIDNLVAKGSAMFLITHQNVQSEEADIRLTLSYGRLVEVS